MFYLMPERTCMMQIWANANVYRISDGRHDKLYLPEYRDPDSRSPKKAAVVRMHYEMGFQSSANHTMQTPVCSTDVGRYIPNANLKRH